MFGLFKKEAILNKETIIKDAPENVSKAIYPKEVFEIHHEFSIASDKLLEECNETLKEAAKKDTDKVLRLEKLGFKQSSQVIETKPLLEKADLSKEQIDLVNYYKREYPLNKFITEEQVKNICYKYNLVCGEVGRFKGFVPEKNLKEIENFKLKQNDIIQYIVTGGKGTFYINKDDIKPNIIKYLETNEYTYVEFSYGVINVNGGYNKYGAYARVSKHSPELQICAPVKDMDINGLELTEGYKLTKKHIPDPVVLQPVKGGYLILTAWGDEQYDPLVFNEIVN